MPFLYFFMESKASSLSDFTEEHKRKSENICQFKEIRIKAQNFEFWSGFRNF